MSMYQIRADGAVIGDLTAPEYAYFSGVLNEEKNNAGRFSFSLIAQNPTLASIKPLVSCITLYRNGAPVWIGRPVSIAQDAYNTRRIVCEGALGYFSDVVYKPPVSLSNVTVTAALTALLSVYNSSCTESRKITLGTVESESNVTISVDSDYLTIFEYLSKIVDLVGGLYIVSISESGAPVLNYYETAPNNAQTIRYGQNLLEIDKLIDATKVVTKLYATGGSGITADVQNDAAVKKYGVIIAHKSFSGVTTAADLQTAAAKWLSENLVGDSLEISAVDLSLADPFESAFSVGSVCRVVSAPHGIDTLMQVTELETNISNPAASRVVLGGAAVTLTKELVKAGRK